MYNTFLKIFASNDLTNTDLSREVTSRFDKPDYLKNIVVDGKDITNDVIQDLKDDKDIKDTSILKAIATNPINALIYIGQAYDKNVALEQIKKLNPSFEDEIMKNWRAALYYFHEILDDNNSEVEKKLVNAINSNKWVGLIPVITDMTKEVYPELQDILTDKLTTNIEEEKKKNSIYYKAFRQLIKVLTNNNLSTGNYTNNFVTILNSYKTWLDNNPKEQEDLNNSLSNKEPVHNDRYFGFVEGTEEYKLYKELGDALKVGENLDLVVNSDELSEQLNVSNTISSIKNAFKKYNEKVVNTVIDRLNIISEDFAKTLKQLYTETSKDVNASINHRSKRMIKANIVKAYTKYYIKNFLPGLLKQASPDMLPQVVNTGVQEVQNMMYGDNVITDFNNPVITNQISTGIQNAVKDPDLIPGGAADGMTLEGIAQKWAPIYNIPVEQLMPILEKQLAAGMVVELEHTNNNAVAREIALDHLTEAADYYSYLENMEHLFPEETVGVKVPPEPENFQPEFLGNPNDQAPCNGHCGDNCQGHCHGHDEVVEIKPQTVEDKLQGLNDGVTVLIMSDEVPTEIEPGYDEVFAHIDNLAKALKR
jgi:hypothetical protein